MGLSEVSQNRGEERGRVPALQQESYPLAQTLMFNSLESLPTELACFRQISDPETLKTYFRFSNNLRELGFNRGDTFLIVGGGHSPASLISAALLGGRALGIEAGFMEADSQKRLVSVIMRAEIGKTIREAQGSITVEQDDFLRVKIDDNSVKVLALPNVINQPSNGFKDEIARKAIKVIMPGSVIILEDSHESMSWGEDLLKKAAQQEGGNLEKVTGINLELASHGIKGRCKAYRVRK